MDFIWSITLAVYNWIAARVLEVLAYAWDANQTVVGWLSFFALRTNEAVLWLLRFLQEEYSDNYPPKIAHNTMDTYTYAMEALDYRTEVDGVDLGLTFEQLFLGQWQGTGHWRLPSGNLLK